LDISRKFKYGLRNANKGCGKTLQLKSWSILSGNWLPKRHCL